MTTARDTDNRVVVHFPIWLHVLGGISSFIAVAFLYFFSLAIRGDIASIMSPMGLLVCIFSPFLLFLGIYLLLYTCQCIFNHTSGIMTIRTGIGPFTYRIRHIPKREVLLVGVHENTSEGFTRWGVSLGISGRKKELKIWVNSKKRAKHLADRIRAFRDREP